MILITLSFWRSVKPLGDEPNLVKSWAEHCYCNWAGVIQSNVIEGANFRSSQRDRTLVDGNEAWLELRGNRSITPG